MNRINNRRSRKHEKKQSSPFLSVPYSLPLDRTLFHMKITTAYVIFESLPLPQTMNLCFVSKPSKKSKIKRQETYYLFRTMLYYNIFCMC